MSPFRSSIAVVIGINEYTGRIPSLRTPVADATRLADVLEQQHGYLVVQLTENVTLGRLKNLWNDDRLALKPDDRLFFYFAGHGIALNGEDGPSGYLVPEDAKLDDPSTFMPMVELYHSLAALPCKHLLLVLDCCFAGSFRWSCTRTLSAVQTVVHKERYDRYVRD